MGISVDSTYFQRLSLCETISRTLEVYAKGFFVFCQLAALTAGISAVVWAALLTVLIPSLAVDATQLENPEYLVDHFGPFYVLLGVNSLVAVLIGAVGNGAFVRAVAGIYLQQEVTLQTCMKVGLRHAGTVLTASFLSFSGMMLGCILLYIPGIYVMVRWFVVNPAIVVEGLGAIAAMKRSWSLVQGSWCYVFCTSIIATCIVMVFQLFWKSLLHLNLYTPMGAILGSIPAIFFGPPLGIMMTIMYINLRIEKEGLNAELFARNLGESDGANAGESNYSSLLTRDEDGEFEDPVTTNV